MWNHRYVQLQWGRNLSVAEGVSVDEVIESLMGLQWGRNLSVAEGHDDFIVPPCGASFNGAATFRLRKA